MPVEMVWDGPPGRRLRAAWRRLPTVLGAVLTCLAAAAVLPLIALTIAVGIYLFVWIDWLDHPEKEWPEWFEKIRGSLVPLWLVALAIAVVGCAVGLRLLRANRKLILFLRRFGYRPATHAVTEATSHLGDFWRVVTLDDDKIEPLAAGGGVESLVDTVSDAKRAYQAAAPVVTKVWKIVMWAAATTLVVALVFVVSPGPDWTAGATGGMPSSTSVRTPMAVRPSRRASAQRSSQQVWRWPRRGLRWSSSSAGWCRLPFVSSTEACPEASRTRLTMTSCISWSRKTSGSRSASSRGSVEECSAHGSAC